MAKLERLGPSSHVLTLKDGTRVLYSYDAPVAAGVPYVVGVDYLKTSAFHSRTTSAHVSRFLGQNKARVVAPEVIAALVEEV